MCYQLPPPPPYLVGYPGAYVRRATAFLEAYARDPCVRRAAAAVGLHRSSVYRYRRDPAFAAAMEAARRAHVSHTT